MKNIVWLSLAENTPARGYWDQHFLEWVFSDYTHQFGIGNLKEAIVIIPGAYQSNFIEQINKELSKLDRCRVIITSDEEGKFPIDQIRHKNGSVYGTYAHYSGRHITWLPIGYPPQLEQNRGEEPRIYDWSFAGQINHKYRQSMLDQVKNLHNGFLYTTSGFAQGLQFTDYYESMKRSKIVLCPRGNVSPDSFRIYEALELGCIPIAEDPQFWRMIFDKVPFPVISESQQWVSNINYCIKNYDTLLVTVGKWWQEQKLSIKRELRND